MFSWLKKQFFRLPLFWRFQVLGWGCFMIYGFVNRSAFWNNKGMGVAMTILMEPTGMLISAGLRSIYTRLNLRSWFTVRTILGVLFITFLAALLHLVISAIGAPLFTRMLGLPPASPRLMQRLMYFWLVFSCWSIGYLWLKAEIQARLRQVQLREATLAAQRAELQMLRLQMNPHFMFNALNNIATQIPEQPDSALEMTHDLADFLRYSLDRRTDLVVPLSHEVDAMTSYLSIERRRFGSRLSFTVDADPQALRNQVPCFLLQPLVENAVKHGLNSSEPPWELGVKVVKHESNLCVQVRNTGQLAQDWETRPAAGIGIANLRRRLELHFPARHRFSLRQEGPEVCSEVILTGNPCLV